MATAFKQVKNNAAGQLESGISDVATSLTLGTGQGASFPSLFPFWVTLFSNDPGEGCEIVLVGGKSGDILQSLTRAQQGTSASAWSAGDNVQLLMTAQHIADLHTAVNSLEAVYDQAVADLTTFEPTKTAIVTIGGVQYRIALDPV